MDDTSAEWRGSVERRLAALEKDVAIILSNYATREDLARLESKLIRWFFATATALALAAFTAGKYLP
ncbi:hypothetical protein [Massilia endophytica]|jgi:hypothetical protein|uniref:hypothetical protein n=1 Tax=Massilia endophytica TaxID=2899220 RepID=UPI001E5D0AE5|nr:hypothetical protein [Massilia endophytica]UGQ46781.1 hypothetical protein LSQ66_23970 [Massilia endophytica]